MLCEIEEKRKNGRTPLPYKKKKKKKNERNQKMISLTVFQQGRFRIALNNSGDMQSMPGMSELSFLTCPPFLFLSLPPLSLFIYVPACLF